MRAATTNRFLDPAVLSEIAGLDLIAKTVVEGFISGLHRSPDFGFSQEFAEYRAYTPRARWIRTANDSYFAAMTYPEGLPLTQQPVDIHDATWGVVSAVYGGAVHPTAEGHAAMADAALAAARQVLNLGAGISGSSVSTQPLAPPNPQ